MRKAGQVHFFFTLDRLLQSMVFYNTWCFMLYKIKHIQRKSDKKYGFKQKRAMRKSTKKPEPNKCRLEKICGGAYIRDIFETVLTAYQ